MRARDERTATEKNQVLMFYLLGENLGGGFHIPLPPSPPPKAFSGSCDLFIRIVLNFNFGFKVLTYRNKRSEML